jgi:3-phosphoglycerate kinase
MPSFESKMLGLLLAKEIESLNKVLKNSENR